MAESLASIRWSCIGLASVAFCRRICVALALFGQEEPGVIDEAFRILKQRSVAGVGIEGHLRVIQMLEHEVRVAVGKHRVVAAAYDQNRLTDGAQNPVARI